MVDRNSGWYTAGQVTGTVVGIGLGFGNPCALGSGFGTALRVINGVQAVGGAINAAENFAAEKYGAAALDALGVFGNVAQMRRACFTGRMLIRTESGRKRADAIRVNDLIWSRDENDPNGPLQLKHVEEVFERLAQIWTVQIGGQSIETTDEHPFWVVNRNKWVPTHLLELGDLLLTEDRRRIAVEVVADSRKCERVYNFRVADWHTYFVSAHETGVCVWAHNLYEVGEYDRVRKLSLRNVREANHAPQTAQAELLIGQFRKGKGISISLPKEEHELISFWQAHRRELFGQLPASARELLAQDIIMLRRFTEAPTSSLLTIVKQTTRANKYDFLPLQRM